MDISDQNIYKPYIQGVSAAIAKLEERGVVPVLLDAGCGHSDVLIDQYLKCKKVIGVDLDIEGLEKNNYVDEKLIADLTKIPLGDKVVDIITSAWVLEHIEYPEKFINECKRLLKVGGYFIAITPNKHGLVSIISRLIPNSLHGTIVKIAYGRPEKDTFKTYFRMNDEKSLDKLFYNRGFAKISITFNDDPKYLGFRRFLRPLAILWHKFVMLAPFAGVRANIIAVYRLEA